MQLAFQGQGTFDASLVEAHNAYAAAHNDLAQRHECLVEAHGRVRDLAVEVSRQLVELRQFRDADAHDILKLMEAAGAKVLSLEERVRSVEAQEGLPLPDRRVH
ncbi:hypothetical protein [Lysobacter enzymogenes]|uniref:hypothetical protein n=1 Tax=Lysobacter enzymogenes TaxID=69 RepID=UPI00099BB5CA|nr:hypothetical protein [Lysobacter enzymogenes]UZW62371.1 hypothetical protein BV903_008815 [Lysobacter enzymogenes]